MKQLIYSAAAMVALICGSCDKDNNRSDTPTVPVNPSTPKEQAIIFKTGIEGITRTPQLDENGSGSFAPGDTFTLYAHNNSGGEKALDYTIGTSELYWNELTFATEGGEVCFRACYPKQELTNGSFNFTTTQDAAGDLLWASATGVSVGTEKPVMLTFRHAMHRLVVKYTVDDPSIEASKIETSCTAYTSCRVDLAEQRLIQIGTKESVSATGQQVQFIVLPQPTNDITLDIRAGETTKHWKFSETDFAYPELEGGKQVTINLTIKAGEIILSGQTIEGWGAQGTIEDEIKI